MGLAEEAEGAKEEEEEECFRSEWFTKGRTDGRTDGRTTVQEDALIRVRPQQPKQAQAAESLPDSEEEEPSLEVQLWMGGRARA